MVLFMTQTDLLVCLQELRDFTVEAQGGGGVGRASGCPQPEPYKSQPENSQYPKVWACGCRFWSF